IVRQNPQETYAPLRQLLVKVAMYGVVVLGILWLAGLVVARKLVSPIQTLHEGVQRIGAGNWDHPLVLKTGDEIEALSHAFNKMAVNLKQSFSQLNTQMAEIRLLEERYRDLIENSPEMIHQIDKTGRFVHVNQTELEKLGFTLLEMLSMHLWDILPAERKAEALDYVNRLPTQPRSSLETVFLTRDGTPIDVEIHSTALIDSDTGDLVYTRAFVRDVTERKALQRQVDRYTTHLEQEVTAQTQQLSESEKRYRVLSEELEEKVQVRTLEIQKTQKYLESLLENANDVIYTLDRDQRFTYVNNKVENWGYRKEDLLGRPFLTLLAKRHRSRRLKDILEFEVKQEYEVEVISQSGELRSVLVSVSPLENERHNVIGVLGIARDITDRKLMEEQFRNAERLASVGKLAAGVAHEINNPLGGILNCLYNIRKGTLPSERQEEYFTYMEDGLRRAQKIVRQLLDFSQQHEPEFSMNDVNGLVDRVLVLTNHAIAEKRLQLHKVYDDDLPPLFVDPQMIEQVLTNLILNAVQATNEGGSIILQTRTAHERCEIDVGDTGSGIDPEVRPHIFDPFFTTKGTGEGTGLGLSVSLGIVERHGGQLTVESEVGKGTVFTVSLPLSANRAALVKVS
ncbi:MAG: PAS domain S-box protein, partial [Nitrospira sp. SB0667_bin_9]|nr:PAS domain S-box protein [Nitrospira sp. SB0667_bin_9]